MKIEIIEALTDNYSYLVVSESGQAAVVDPAEADPVIARVEQLGVDLAAIWNTHHHWDHTGGNKALCRRFDGLSVIGHSSDADRIPGFTQGLDHGDRLVLGELDGEALHVPGHTRGGIALSFPRAVFTGDTLFGCGCGRLFEGTPEILHRSLNETMAVIDDDTDVYCGHEYTEKNLAFAKTVDPHNMALVARSEHVSETLAKGGYSVPFPMAVERQTNPFLRCETLAVMDGLRARVDGVGGSDPVSVFAQLRSLRDRF